MTREDAAAAEFSRTLRGDLERIAPARMGPVTLVNLQTLGRYGDTVTLGLARGEEILAEARIERRELILANAMHAIDTAARSMARRLVDDYLGKNPEPAPRPPTSATPAQRDTQGIFRDALRRGLEAHQEREAAKVAPLPPDPKPVDASKDDYLEAIADRAALLELD